MQAIESNIVHYMVDFEDYFPSMMARMGSEGFIWELCSGFRLLMDAEKGLITFESLKRNSVLLGLHDLLDEELACMLMEGDLDGDGALSQTEFCVLMFKLSPGLMEIHDQHYASKQWISNNNNVTSASASATMEGLNVMNV